MQGWCGKPSCIAQKKTAKAEALAAFCRHKAWR
jgi:phenylpropionate dioxygenase-like ring-hydroxylating dioxygenase large terminal subunit